MDSVLGVVLGLLLAVATVVAGVSVNANDYGNNDVTVNTINSGAMVVMIADVTPSAFNARSFVTSAYPLYVAANPAITSMNGVVMVGWCAKKETVLNSSLSCLNGSKFNDDSSYPYVFIQMRFPTWDSTAASPANVDLSSLKVLSQLAVTSFVGTYDPDKNTSVIDSSYITNISYNSAAVYAVFGVLVGVVVIALIITCVCICKRDNAMASVNKNIIDKAINKLRSDRHKPGRDNAAGANNFAAHYNLNGDAGMTGPLSPAVMPATTTAGLGPREGSNTYASPPDSRMAEREMQEMKARQMMAPDASNLQKQAA